MLLDQKQNLDLFSGGCLVNPSDFGLSESKGRNCEDEDITGYLPEQTCDSDGEAQVVADQEEEEAASSALADGDYGGSTGSSGPSDE